MSSIRVSQKHGVNPTMLVCHICHQETGELALLGLLPGDKEAGRYTDAGTLCDNCQTVIDQGGTIILEADKDKKRTGRVTGLKKGVVNESFGQVVMMLSDEFEQAFGSLLQKEVKVDA